MQHNSKYVQSLGPQVIYAANIAWKNRWLAAPLVPLA